MFVDKNRKTTLRIMLLMQRRNTSNVKCHLAMKTRQWLRTFTISKKYGLQKTLTELLQANCKKRRTDN